MKNWWVTVVNGGVVRLLMVVEEGEDHGVDRDGG